MGDHIVNGEPNTAAEALRKRAHAAWLAVTMEELLPALRTAAKSKGYALGLHGSMARDVDLIAAPWTDEACSAEDLFAAMLEAVQATLDCGFMEKDRRPSKRPHGRAQGPRPYTAASFGSRATDTTISRFHSRGIMPRGPPGGLPHIAGGRSECALARWPRSILHTPEQAATLLRQRAPGSRRRVDRSRSCPFRSTVTAPTPKHMSDVCGVLDRFRVVARVLGDVGLDLQAPLFEPGVNLGGALRNDS